LLVILSLPFSGEICIESKEPEGCFLDLDCIVQVTGRKKFDESLLD